MSETSKTLSAFARKVRETYKADVIQVVDEMGQLAFGRHRTGVLALDVVTGGGVPRGKCTSFVGAKGSGKTTAMMRLIARVQNECRRCGRVPPEIEVLPIKDREKGDLGPSHYVDAYCDCVRTGLVVPKKLLLLKNNVKELEKQSDYDERINAWKSEDVGSFLESPVLFIDVEGKFDPSWARKQGVDTRRLLLMQPSSAEQAIDVADCAVDGNTFALVCIDSLAALTPDDEREKSTEDWQQGLQARLLNKAMRKWVASQNDVGNETGMPPTLAWIQQERMKIGVMFGSPITKPGGKGQEFATCCEVSFWTSDVEVEKLEVTGNKEDALEVPVSQRVNVKCTKNQTGVPHKKSFYELCLRDRNGYKVGDPMEHEYIAAAAVRLNVVSKNDKAIVYPGNVFPTSAKFLAALRDDPAVYAYVYEQVLKKLTAD